MRSDQSTARPRETGFKVVLAVPKPLQCYQIYLRHAGGFLRSFHISWWRNILQEDPGRDSSSYPSCLFLAWANSNRLQSHLGFKAFSPHQQDLLQTRLLSTLPPAPHLGKPCLIEKTEAGLYHRVHTHLYHTIHTGPPWVAARM